MNRVQRALEANNLAAALPLLDRHRPTHNSEIPKSDSPDLRGWEWRYLWSQCQTDAQSLLCQVSNVVSALTVSHDGKWLAVALRGQGISVLDLATHQEIVRLPSKSGVIRAAFSPQELLLAYSVESGSTNTQDNVRLWNGLTHQMVTNLSLGGLCLDLTFAHDGRTLVTATQDPDNHLTLWRVTDGLKLAEYEIPQNGPGEGTPLAVAGDLSVAAHVAEYGQVRVIELAGGQQRWKQKASDDFVLSLALSPDGKLLACGEGWSESAIHLWDVDSGTEIGRLEGHRAGVWRLLFWPDGKTLASLSLDQTIRLWDVSKPAAGRSLSTLRGVSSSDVQALALLHDNTTLASTSKDGVCLWNTATARGQRQYVTLPAQLEEWRFAPDSKAIVGVDIQGRVAQWQGKDFEEMHPLLEIGKFDEVRISADCHWMADAWAGRGIRIWDLQNRTRSGEFVPPAGNNPGTGLPYTHSRTRVGEFTGNPGPVALCQFLAHGSKLMLIHRCDNSLHEWDLKKLQEARSWPGAPGISTYAFSQDEHWCIVSTIAPRVGSTSSLIDLTTGQKLPLNLEFYSDASFSPDGKLIAGASWARFARLWETTTRREVATLGGFLFGVDAVTFSPDGKRLATGSQGKEAIKLWDIESQQELLTLEGRGSWFNSAAFSPDGTILGCNNQRGWLHLWRAPSWEEIDAAENHQGN